MKVKPNIISFFCLIVEILVLVSLCGFFQMRSALRLGSALGRMPNRDVGDPGTYPARGQFFMTFFWRREKI